MRNIIALMAILLFILPRPTLADEASTQAEKAAIAYTKGDFQGAIDGYNGLMETGHSGAETYYNLGNAYHRAGELGEAILAYKNALRQSPRDIDTQSNLEFLRTQSQEKLTLDDRDPDLKSFIFWYDALSLSELTSLSIALNAVFFAGLFFWYRRKGQGNDLPMPLWVPVTLVAMLIFASTAVARQWDDTFSPDAVILYPEVTARSDTDLKGVALFYLHEGAEVEALGEAKNGWTQLRLPDGRRGWVQSEFVGIVCAPDCQ